MSEQDATKVEQVIGSPVDLGEAGGVAWVDVWQLRKVHNTAGEVVGSAPYKISLTCRAATPTEALNGLMDAIEFAGQKYGMRPYAPDAVKQNPKPRVEQGAQAATGQAVPPTSPAVPPVPPQAKTAVPPVPPTSPAASGSPAAGEANAGVLVAVKMVVTPRADGKTKVDFYGAGRKFADLSATMTPEQLSTMMATVGAWTPEHFNAIGEYAIKYKVSWRNSERTNTAGKPYKDIVGLAL